MERDTAVATIELAEGLPLHLAHLQFYAYTKEGGLGMSSGAVKLAEALAKHRNVTADIGQVMFGPTITISSDVLTQFNARRRAKPKKWIVRDGDSNGGGVVPLTLSPEEQDQRDAVGDRAGAVPADR